MNSIYVKMSKYSHIIHCLQGKLTYLGRELSVVYVICAKFFLKSSNLYFGTKYIKKSDKKNFQLYQVFLHNFLYQNDWIFTKIF